MLMTSTCRARRGSYPRQRSSRQEGAPAEPALLNQCDSPRCLTMAERGMTPAVLVAMDLNSLWNLLWLYFIFASLQPALQKQWMAAARRRMLASISSKRNATVITLIHRQETISLLGFPIMRHIDIDDSQSVLRAIRSTAPGKTIEIILHTPGGLVLAASQIAQALSDHDGRVVAVVPHYAMSGGTLIALAADEIVIDRHAALGPVDPQLGQYAARSLVDVAARPGRHSDQTLLLADVGRKALVQVEATVVALLEKHMEPARARD